MASKKKSTKKKSAKKKSAKAKKKVHSVHITSGKPSPSHLTGVKHGDKVKITKSERSVRFVSFQDSPFRSGGGKQKLKVPVKGKSVVADPDRKKSYEYRILDKDGNVVTNKKKSGPPNPPDIVVG
jgi:hypothetical protein